MSDRASAWWGRVSLEQGQRARLELGPLVLWIKRRRSEWRLGVVREPEADPRRATVVVETRPGSEQPTALVEEEVARFGMEEPGPALELRPVLAPRPVACRPDQPFVLIPGSRVTAYVSTPLWVRVTLPDGTLLQDIDVHRPSGSWFGPDTLDGELCYASRTQLRLHEEDVELVPHRAITAVHLHNPLDTPLPISQVNVPVPGLHLAARPDGSLWTEELTMGVRSRGLAAVDIGALPTGAEVLSPPARPDDSRSFTRALAHLLR